VSRIVLLALGWIALSGSFEPANVGFGGITGFLLHRLLPSDHGERWTMGRALGMVALAWFFVWELILSNVRVALVVLDPRRLRAAVVAVPLDARSDVEITTLANLITLTPGPCRSTCRPIARCCTCTRCRSTPPSRSGAT
jgi:multicomponent Na+:H+ antiporter subunit E